MGRFWQPPRMHARTGPGSQQAADLVDSHFATGCVLLICSHGSVACPAHAASHPRSEVLACGHEGVAGMVAQPPSRVRNMDQHGQGRWVRVLTIDRSW